MKKEKSYKKFPQTGYFSVDRKKYDSVCDGYTPFVHQDLYKLYYIKEGNCVYETGKKKYAVGTGNWVFVPRKRKHKLLYNVLPCETVEICFSTDYIPYLLLEKMSLFTSNPVFEPQPKEKRGMENILEKLMNEFAETDEYSEQMYKNLLSEIMISFVRNTTFVSGKVSENPLVDYAAEYIKHNFAENITLEKLAAETDVSRSYMSRKFKAVMGVNLRDYIRYIRIEKAKAMLIETNDSVSKISERCGFEDSNYFSYVFKQMENISPLEYRKNYS